ncbi:MAG: hypothetical protein JXD21_05995 [Candidatus Omnitrophica bacterium]|nr:hypothetical protein [Candidatus Omnitrophota bacterium]
MEIILRKFPYPYKAALSICNDIDYMTKEKFIAIHSFLSSKDEGLGLEIADSFWMYAIENDLTGSFSYFKGLSDELSAIAALIEKMVQHGYIDSLHTYGNFSQYPGFRRKLAQRGVELMKNKSMNIAVWTNHGNMLNLQNIGLSNACGDTSCIVGADGDKRECCEYEESMYHSDITVSGGIRYVWIDKLTEIIGQGRPCGVIEAAFSKLDRCVSSRSFIYRFFQIGVSLLLVVQKKTGIRIVAESLRQKLFAKIYDGDNDLARIVTLRDGQRVYSFTRYGRFGIDDADSIPVLLSKKTLKRLKQKQGYMVVFAHLAKSKSAKNGQPFSQRTRDAFSNLALESRKDVYVTTTGKLLQYYTVTKYLKWRVEEKDGAVLIHIDKVNDPVRGDYIPTEIELQGVTFYVPDVRRASVDIAGHPVDIQKNPKDSTGKESVTIPLVRLAPFEDVMRTIEESAR